ncbi:DUF222 domain-containing protein [Arthrobacter sp. BE255]|uniref:HNH endonuclease signature motif containing protein n=1 Tax=Arthrobacter sp. BE255 TaxID=2817721 RepID=UPI00285F515B|nr:DUF222 domain-containing protein [Arthrobacter sp. BE255]MDR7160229.1 hypothetical protein [Arthrobacter sp. BE255]
MGSGVKLDSVEAMMASMASLAVLAARSEGRSGHTGSDPLRDRADACLEGLEETARVEAMLAARKVRFAAGFAETMRAMSAPDEQPHQRLAREMGVVAEVACALTVSERTASALLAESHQLTTTLPLTQAALEQGLMSWQHARVMVDEATSLDPAGAAALEAHFLDPDAPNPDQGCPAGDLVPSRFRQKARTWRERHHPVSIEKRHAKSVLDRRLEYAPDRDGMAWLSAYLPADQAAGIWNGVTAAARALQGPAEDRTMTQLRADIAAKLLLSAGLTTTGTGNSDATTAGAHESVAGGVRAADAATGGDVLAGRVSATEGVDVGHVPSPAAQVLVTVPVFALMGLTGEPAMLDGYGPIPASVARKLVAEGASSFHRVLTDSRNGAPLEIGRNSYRIPPAMRQWLHMRDSKCSFPGCSNQSLDNEADHLLAWADGGTTGITNLESLCRKHHRLKHSTTWTPTEATKDQPPGWTSPTGRRYHSEHPDWEPPQWPKQILDQLAHHEPGRALPDAALPAGVLSDA